MARKLVWVAAVLMLGAVTQCALAMGSVVLVTKDNQAKLGLNYTLVADRVDDEAVLVKMAIPRTGKLKRLRTVSMRIGSGRPLVYAALQTMPGNDGSWVVQFQVAPSLADKCSVDLIVPTGAKEYLVYAVELKGYVTARN